MEEEKLVNRSWQSRQQSNEARKGGGGISVRIRRHLTNAINGSKKLHFFLEDRDYSKIN